MIKNNYSPCDETVRARIHERFNVDSDGIKRDIEIIREWIRQQSHLPQDIQDDDFLEKCLLRNKFRVEHTKEKLEKYYSLKAISANEIARIRSALPIETRLTILPLPVLTDKMERIILIRTNNSVTDDEELIMRSFKYTLCTSEYSLRCDYSVGYRIIQDFEGLTYEQVKKYAIALGSFPKSYSNAYFARIAGVEYLNVPPFVEAFLKGVKAVLTAKMFSKISVHKNFESLHKNVDKAYLPPEYGGDLDTSMDELLGKWNQEIESNVDALEKVIVSEISNESLRVGEVKYNEAFGVDGTFKSLALD
ncbi:hypothetical protein MTP99_006606 [Tenebrio molitor]|nr:hypothetical protein MTP99_006606 [Tenebrio molitor]